MSATPEEHVSATLPHSNPASIDTAGHADKGKDAVRDVAVDDVPPRYNFFRTPLFSVVIVSLCSWLSPGVWGAMSYLGAGGTQSISLVNAANSVTFVLMIFTALGTSAIVNKTSVRTTLIFGCAGYAPYAAGLYTKSKYDVNWFVVLGAALCGISAGTFWSIEASIALGYPQRDRVGRYISLWLAFRVLGQLMGGAINLGLNAKNNQKGSVSVDTYLVFIVLQCLSPVVALLLSQPHQVRRGDGTKVHLGIASSTRAELKNVGKLLLRKEVLLLLPMMWGTAFPEAVIGTYAAKNTSVRSRALGSFLSAIIAAIGNYILGLFIDWRKFSINRRIKYAWIAVFTLQGAFLSFALVVVNRLEEDFRSGRAITYDWETPGWGRVFAVYLLLQLGWNLMYELIYFVVANLTTSSEELIRLASIVRATESAGQSVSYGINSTSLRLDAVIGWNMAQWAIALFPAWLVTRKLGFGPNGEELFVPLEYVPPPASQERRGSDSTVTDEVADVKA